MKPTFISKESPFEKFSKVNRKDKKDSELKGFMSHRNFEKPIILQDEVLEGESNAKIDSLYSTSLLLINRAKRSVVN